MITHKALTVNRIVGDAGWCKRILCNLDSSARRKTIFGCPGTSIPFPLDSLDFLAGEHAKGCVFPQEVWETAAPEDCAGQSNELASVCRVAEERLKSGRWAVLEQVKD
ncbi:MAG: hypothetical protein LAN71_11205 [Acidobacteriia bacterium]|nr:hypothetical protein [Terriglobia bacterium]